ncbi:MAG: site-specific DNA-methyltransferase [Nitrospirae bacterium]|nr:site-specific DNA-methyltransferase [Nitrospirota bacterium]
MTNINEKTDYLVKDLIEGYNKSKKPINVNFRKMLMWLSVKERTSHLIHFYPAKLLRHIPYFFLNNSFFSSPGDIVLDPFCGSGTVLLEALLAGRNAIGADINPLGCLISRVKTTQIDESKMRKTIKNIKSKISEYPGTIELYIINLEYWFYPRIIEQLKRILEAVTFITDTKLKEFLLVCFSNCLRRVSLADPILYVPVKLNIHKYPKEHSLYKKVNERLDYLSKVNVFDEFFKLVNENLERIVDLNKCSRNDISTTVLCADARNLILNTEGNDILQSESIHLVITSPPYAGAQKYIRSTRLHLSWLRLCTSLKISELERTIIGREHYRKAEYSKLVELGFDDLDKRIEHLYKINPIRAYIIGNYIKEMRDVFIETKRVLKKDGYLILITASNYVCGEEFETHVYLTRILESIGFIVVLVLIDDIRSRGLMTKRNRTANIITREWVIVLKKIAYK